MKSLFELEKKRSEAEKRHRNKEKSLEAEKEKIDAKIKRMRYPHLHDFLEKLAKQILPQFKGATWYEILGPFGLSNESTLYIKTRKGRTLGGITFARFGDGYGIKGRKNTRRYAVGSIAEMNGGNYETMEITEEMTIDWIVKYMKKGYRQ